MQYDTFHGYGKPLMVLDDGVLTNVNVPVPTRAYHFPRLPQVLLELAELHSVKKLGKLFRKKKDPSASKIADAQTRAVVVAKILYEQLVAIPEVAARLQGP
jgi:hypothetical protein